MLCKKVRTMISLNYKVHIGNLFIRYLYFLSLFVALAFMVACFSVVFVLL